MKVTPLITRTNQSRFLVCGGATLPVHELRQRRLAFMSARSQRDSNQDGLLVMEQPRRVLAVADGLGGIAGGGLASRIALETLSESVEDGLALKDCFMLAQQEIVRCQSGEFAFMGTTLTAVELGPDHLEVCHIGDSRIYMVKGDGQVTLLTLDNSIMSEAYQLENPISMPLSDPGEYCIFIRTNIAHDQITHYLGCSPLPFLNYRYPIGPGDRLLLCSDGVYNFVHHYDLTDLLGLQIPPGELVARLHEYAEQWLVTYPDHQGDNLTAIVYEQD